MERYYLSNVRSVQLEARFRKRRLVANGKRRNRVITNASAVVLLYNSGLFETANLAQT